MLAFPLVLQFEDSFGEGLLRLASLLLGLAIVIRTFIWATQVVMIQESEPPPLARAIFKLCRSLLLVTGKLVRDPKKQRRYWSLYMPLCLLSLLFVAMIFATIGFIFVIYGISNLDLRGSLFGSVSSMSTLGFANQPKQTPTAVIYAIEGMTTTFFVGVLIVYVNSIFDDFSNRRSKMRRLDTLVDRAPTGAKLLENAAEAEGLASLTPFFGEWAADFVHLKRSHRTLEVYLSIYSPNTEQHWAVDAPVVLDAANLRNTLVDLPPDPQAARCLKHGPDAIADAVKHFSDKMFATGPAQSQRVFERASFNQAASELRLAGVPVVSDLDSAWQTFEENRARYEPALTGLRTMLDLAAVPLIGGAVEVKRRA